MELTQQQKARIFAMYLGQECIYNGQEATVFSPNFCATQNAQIKLRTTDQITDEEAIEVAKMMGMDDPNEILRGDNKGMIAASFCDMNYEVAENNYHPFVVHSVYEYFKLIGIAGPLFIAPNHPDNGKDAIQLQLAISQQV